MVSVMTLALTALLLKQNCLLTVSAQQIVHGHSSSSGHELIVSEDEMTSKIWNAAEESSD